MRIAVEEDLCRCGETLSDENISGIIGLLYFNIYKSLYQIYLFTVIRPFETAEPDKLWNWYNDKP